MLQCSGHPLILDTMRLWKAADCPLQPQKSPLWSLCFCQYNPTFMLHLQTKVLSSFLTSSHLSWPISQQNFVLLRMVAKKNLHFFLHFWGCFFFSFWCIGDTLNSRLWSQHSLPPSGSFCATPPHLPVLLPLYAIWFMNSKNITVLFRKKKITFSFDPLPVLIVLPLIPFLLQKSLLSPFFRKYIPFFDSKITTSVPFENSFISAGIFCQLPPHFRSPFPSVWSLKSCCIFLTSLLLSAHFT